MVEFLYGDMAQITLVKTSHLKSVGTPSQHPESVNVNTMSRACWRQNHVEMEMLLGLKIVFIPFSGATIYGCVKPAVYGKWDPVANQNLSQHLRPFHTSAPPPFTAHVSFTRQALEITILDLPENQLLFSILLGILRDIIIGAPALYTSLPYESGCVSMVW
jgi:hypothetical protein